jgi:phenylalanyl-tRNA synthetase alpha subunit
MTESLSPKQQVEAANKAFEQEFERFARFTGDSSGLSGLDLEGAIAEEKALAELRTRHLGKKSALAATKKLIGRVPADERAAFGQLVQATTPHRVSSRTSINNVRRARVST